MEIRFSLVISDLINVRRTALKITCRVHNVRFLEHSFLCSLSFLAMQHYSNKLSLSLSLRGP
jgi:hypothetical protein